MVSLVWVSVEYHGLREGVRYRESSGLGKKGDYCLVKIRKAAKSVVWGAT